MARLYANENFPIPVVEELRRLGHDTLTSYESGRSNQAIPDEEVLRFAFNQERTLVTLNRKHFIQLHKKNLQYSIPHPIRSTPQILRLPF
jgi:hypothetical protein